MRAYTHKGHTIHIWYRRAVRQWCFDIWLHDHLVDAGTRATWAQAARAAITRIEDVRRLQRGQAA